MRCSAATLIVVLCLLSTATATDAVELKIATLAPDGSFWMNEARKAADEIESKTSGRVSFRFYPGGIMGTEEAVLRKMRIGQLHGGVVLAGTFDQIVPDIQIYELPLLFTSYEEVDAIRANTDERLLRQLADGGYHSFGFIEGGFAYLFTTSKASSFADLDGRKAWIPDGDPIGRVLVEEAGLSPVPLGLSDVLTGLQTGLVDVVSGPPVAAVALQWFTKVKYRIDMPVLYTYGCMVIAQRAWSGMSADDRAIVDEVLSKMTHTLDRRAREDNQEAKRALEAQGVVSVTPDEATASRWEALAKRSSARLVEELGLDAGLVAEIERELGAIRAAAEGGGDVVR